jgi:hypothetical protein
MSGRDTNSATDRQNGLLYTEAERRIWHNRPRRCPRASRLACWSVYQASIICGSSAGISKKPARPRISAAHMAATTGTEGAAVAD